MKYVEKYLDILPLPLKAPNRSRVHSRQDGEVGVEVVQSRKFWK